MRYVRALTTFLIAAAIAVSGCNAENDSPATDKPTFNQADVTFARGMIPHHRQAIQMAKLADGRTNDPRVDQLAQQIEAAQGPEIETMQGWLQAWNKSSPTHMGGSGSMDHDKSMNGMSGMMQNSDMAQLRSAQGAAFDEVFLTMMIAHHKGAIAMASAEEQQGRNPQAIAMAKKIQKDQAAEIGKMTDLLGG